MSYLKKYVKVCQDFLSKTYALLNKQALYPWYVFSLLLIYFIVTNMTLENVHSLDDHFFHIRFAEEFRQKGVSVFTDFNSIYFSRMGIVKDYFVYYNFLFYIALIPFTFISPLVVGIKLYGVFVLTALFFSVYLFLRKISVRYPFMWMMLFLLGLLQSGYLSRFALARPFSLSPVFLVVLLYFIHKKKYFPIALISFLYFFWHTATLMFPFCLVLGYYVFEKFYGKKSDWKIVFWSLLGTFGAISLAYMISPGVISYLKDVIFPVFFDTSLTKTTGIAEGGEVYGRDIITTTAGFFLFFASLVIAGIYEILRYIQLKKDALKNEDEMDLSIQPLRAMLFMASISFFGATALSGRFLDYFVVFCVLYVAIAMSDAIRFFEIKGELFRKSLKISVFIIAIYLFTNLSLNMYNALSVSKSQLTAMGPAEWLNTNLEKGKIVFNTEWDSFPTLYYFTGDRFRYTTGLEPRFLYDLDQTLYWEWWNVGKGMYCQFDECPELIEEHKALLSKKDELKKWEEKQGNLIANVILSDFKTDIMVVSVNRKDLLDVMDNSNRFKKESFDDKISAYAIYRIVDNKN
jgi:hypothetical protein